MSFFSHDRIAKCAEDFDDNKDASPAFTMLSEAIARHRITIIGGSSPEWSNGRLSNIYCIFGSDGKLLAKHRKVSTSKFKKLVRKILRGFR